MANTELSIEKFSLNIEGFMQEMASQLDQMGMKPCSEDDFFQRWINFKNLEKYATESRREIEDQLIQMLGAESLPEGTKTRKDSGFVVKITTRMNRKVDSEMLQDLAAEAGLTDHLTSLFRWKPELNIKAWKAADPSITGQLARAIEAKPGRPSFAITQETD